MGGVQVSIEARICHSHEAAEVLRLRAALKNHKHTDACRNYAAEKRHAYCITECLDSYEYALAAEPGPLVAAVEGVVRAAASLREFERAPLCAIRGRDGAEWERLRLALDSALAAYRAALGEVNRG